MDALEKSWQGSSLSGIHEVRPFSVFLQLAAHIKDGCHFPNTQIMDGNQIFIFKAIFFPLFFLEFRQKLVKTLKELIDFPFRNDEGRNKTQNISCRAVDDKAFSKARPTRQAPAFESSAPIRSPLPRTSAILSGCFFEVP